MAQSKEERNAKQRAYRKAHLKKNAAYMRDYRARRVPKLRLFILHQLGERCANCGITDERVLTIDHRHGGGNSHRKKNSIIAYYTDIANNLDDFRLLCWNCNWIAHKYPDDQVATV